LVPQGISSYSHDVPLHIHPESHNKIHDERGAHGEKGNINKPCSDARWRKAHFFTDSRAHPEQFPFDKISQAVHGTNLNIKVLYRKID
jgi:hypothetical protein